jgi:predicted DNA-binding protein YlxM (UPF0122 family)
MEERVEISILLDFYNELLTEKQRDIMEMYYNEDLSLGEIAELNNTSRQAIYDNIKRCHKVLLEYEKKLGLRLKNDMLVNMKQSIIDKCAIIKSKCDNLEITNYIEQIEKELTENI